MYPEDPQYQFHDPASGVTYDMRVLMQAANEVKIRGSSTTPPVPTLGVTGGSPPAPPGQTGPVIPRDMVEGEAAIFRDSRVQAALQGLGWGGNTRQQLTKMLEFVEPAVKARWKRGG